MHDKFRELELLIRSHYSLIVIDSTEEKRTVSLVRMTADRLRLPFFIWSGTKGLVREDTDSKGPVYGSQELNLALSHIEASKFTALYYFDGLSDYLGDKHTDGALKDAVGQFSRNYGALVMRGQHTDIPASLKTEAAVFKMPAPDAEEYRELLGRVLRDLNNKMVVDVDLQEEDRNRLLNNIKGLTLTEAEKIITKLVVENGRLTSSDIRKVMEAKKDIIEREGVLEYYPVEESMADIADLRGLKAWLSKRKEIVLEPEKAEEFGLTFPKGVLLLGVPGCGKSLCAKAVAMEWGLPLLRLDPSGLYNKYMGESEKNFKRAMTTAEKMSPVVLWIDEIEKAFSSASGTEDGGVSTRIFGTFLSWLQDRSGDVFIVATANDVTKLPPEFLRKGRFDEIFFVDLPDRESRKAIFRIHLEKRGKDASVFDLERLSAESEGFSGSEIEQVIVSGLYTAFSQSSELSAEILMNEISVTHPLSRTMPERICSLREWARGKTVSAH